MSTFGPTGAFTSASLEDSTGAMTALSTGGLVVAADGSVTGTLANGTAATAHRYEITGSMRALKDLITGVLTARLGSTVVYQGLVTMVREMTQLDLGQASYSVVEGQPVHVTVRRTGNQAGTVTVDYSASGGTAPAGDYTVLGSGTLTFSSGVSSKIFDVATKPDGVVQGSRTVNLFLANATGAVIGTNTAPLTIQDNDVGGVVKFATAGISVLEGTQANLTLTRSGGMGGNVTVQWATADGTAIGSLAGDYFPASGTVTFGPNEVSKQITVSTISEGIAEGDESFRVILHTPVGLTIGTPASATVTLLDAQQGIQFGAPEYTVSEAMVSAAISVIRSGPVSTPATVRYSTSPGSATPGADYTTVQGVVTFAANSRTATFMVPVLPDMRAEGAETVLLTLSDPSAPAQLLAQRTATLTIIDNDVPGVIKLGAATYTVAESAKSVLVTVQRTGNAEGVTVSYATVPGTATPGQDYLTANGVLTFGAGETTKTIAITILNDSLDELAETFTVTLLSPGGGATLGTPSSAVDAVAGEPQPHEAPERERGVLDRSGVPDLHGRSRRPHAESRRNAEPRDPDRDDGAGDDHAERSGPWWHRHVQRPLQRDGQPRRAVTISFTATVTGAITGTATATGSGVITDGVVTADITSGLLTRATAPLGSCPFTGTLTAAGQPVMFFSLLHFAQGGGFDGLTTPTPVYPLPITQFSLGLAAIFDTPQATSSVTFTGPAGSLVTNVPAHQRRTVTAGSFYETDTMSVTGRNLIGNWSVRYRGVDRPFTVTDPQTATRSSRCCPR